MNLEAFGQKLRAFRRKMGLTQIALAQQVPVSTELLSNWERAYQHQGRHWVPERQAVIRLVEIFAGHLRPEETQAWLALLDIELSKAELQKIFAINVEGQDKLISPVAIPQMNFKQLKTVIEQHLVGTDENFNQLFSQLEKAAAPWVIAIDGIGGIGKTSLASLLIRRVMSMHRFYDVIWISTKPEEFVPGLGFQPTDRPEFTVTLLIDAILEQLGVKHLLSAAEQEKALVVASLLKNNPYLVVIDNLEAIADYQNWIPQLQRFTNPSKFLLTSRHRLHMYSDIFCYTLPELTPADVAEFLSYEARLRGMASLLELSQSHLTQLYEVVGGNPLALKLIVGQIAVLPLLYVLANLREAKGKSIDDLYTHIYWQAWQALTVASQKALLAMPLAQGGDFAQIAAISKLDIDDLQQALAQLVTLSLVTVYGNLENQRYDIHRLTETFLLHEVIKWQTS